MKLSGAFIFLILIIPFFGQAQEREYSEPQGLNNWYLEAAGAGYLYSFNYEKILHRSDNLGWVGRIGLGYNPMYTKLLNKLELDGKTYMMPFTMAVLLGSRERKEKIELGAGFTMLAKSITEREVAFTGVIGFRVIETNSIIFRATYTPIINQHGEFVSWFGISLGKNFSLK